MKKKIIPYLITWCLLVGLYNILCFVTPNQIYGLDKYAGSFWAGYVFITLAFVLHLFFNIYMFSAKSKCREKMNTPLIILSYGGLSIMTIVGILCMFIPNLPSWVGIISCYTVLIVSIVYILMTKVVTENANTANNVLNAKTFEFRCLIDEADSLTKKANCSDAKLCAKEIYDAVRYSDLMSSAELYSEEQEIKKLLSDLQLIISDDTKIDEIKKIKQELIELISIRNNKCKTLKRRIQ